MSRKHRLSGRRLNLRIGRRSLKRSNALCVATVAYVLINARSVLPWPRRAIWQLREGFGCAYSPAATQRLCMSDNTRAQHEITQLKIKLFDPFEARLGYKPDSFAHRVASTDIISDELVLPKSV